MFVTCTELKSTLVSGFFSKKKRLISPTCCPLTANLPEKYHTAVQSGLFHCQIILQLLVLILDSCLSCMTCSSLRSMYDPDSNCVGDIQLQLSFVLREPICQLQTSRCPTYHTARLLQRLSNNEHIDGRPLVLQRCWAPNCQLMIVQTLTVCNTHRRSLLHHRWSTTQIERTVNQLLQKQSCPFDESQGHRHCLCFGTQRARHCATHSKRIAMRVETMEHSFHPAMTDR